MSKNKLKKFLENESFPHFFQPSWEELKSEFSMKGNWNKNFFKNENPIVVELGCGHGDYVVALSQKYPNKNFIGIDKKGARMWRGAKTTLENQQGNAAFIRTKAETIDYVFGKNEVDEIWITFPEPQPNKPRENKRFTSAKFIERFAQILKPEGIIHLKTDNTELYNYTLEVIEKTNCNIIFKTDNIYKNEESHFPLDDLRQIKTFYEQIWLKQGIDIKYICFKIS